MRRLAFLLAALGGAAVVVSTSVAGTPTSASVRIRHQVHGCHAWSVDNGPFHASQTVHLARGGTLTVVNDDVMPQPLFEKSGAKVHESGNAKLNTMAASVKLTFTKAGTYRFATKAGEDYPGVKAAPTVGEDNVLTLTVIVS